MCIRDSEFAAPPDANLSVSITPDVISDAAIWLDDRDTQLLTHHHLITITGYLYHLTRLLHQILHQVLLRQID